MAPFDSSAFVPVKGSLWGRDGSVWVHARATKFKGARPTAPKQIQEPGEFEESIVICCPLLLSDSSEPIHVIPGLLKVPGSIPGQPSRADKDYKNRDRKQGPTFNNILGLILYE